MQTAPAPRGIPHPQSEYAKRINRFAAASPISKSVQKHVAALVRKRGLDLVHDRLAFLDLAAHCPNGVRIYHGIASRDEYVVKGTVVLRGTVSDLLGQLRQQTSSTHDCRRSFYQLFLRTFSHSVNFPQEDNTVNPDAVHVHWLALRGDGVHSSPFDVVFASHSQQYVWDRSEWRPWTHHDGSHRAREAGTHVWESIDTRATPSFHDAATSTGCARLHVYRSGFVVEKSADLANFCNVSFVLRFNEHGLSQTWLHELVGGFPRFLRPDLFLVVPTQLWSYNEYCHMCFKTFRLYRRRHHCRLCGHAICSSCSHNVEVDVASDVEAASFVERTAVLVCLKCSVHYRASRQNGSTTSSSYQHQMSASASSSSRRSVPRRMSRPEAPTRDRTQATFADDNESTFTIHAPAPSSLSRQSSGLLPMLPHDDLDLEALYTIHAPLPTATGLRQHESSSLPIFTRPSDVDLSRRPSISLSSMSQSSTVRRRPSTSQSGREIGVKAAPPFAAPPRRGSEDRSTVLYVIT